MRKTALLKILKTLSTKDITEFRKFLQSPYHSESDLLLKFFDYLRKYQPEYASYRLKKEYLFPLFFHDKIYTKTQAGKRLNNMACQLKQLLEEYLAIREFKKNKRLKNRMLAKAYSHTHDYHLFKSNIEDAITAIEKSEHKNEDYYLGKMLLHQLEYEYPVTRTSRNKGEVMADMMDNLDEYFILNKLKGELDLVTRTKKLEKDYQINLLDEIKELIENTHRKDIPRIRLFQLVIHTFSSSFSEENYFKLKEEFLLYRNDLTKLEQLNIWICLFNYYSFLVRKNENINKNEIWELQKMGLQEKILLQNGQMIKEKFENIVVVSCSLKEFDWCQKFIQKYAPLLSPEQRDNAVILSQSYYHFNKNEFRKVIGLLQSVEFTDHGYKSRTRSLLLRSYYELIKEDVEYYDTFFALSQSFEKYIRRDLKKWSKDKTEGYINFIILIREFAKFIIGSTREKNRIKNKLPIKFATMENLVARPWFEERLQGF